jgi:2'-5' RNA ligase
VRHDGAGSALVVVASEAEPVVAAWRHRYHGHSVARGVPPHVTVLFPFVPTAGLEDDVCEELRRLYAPLATFAYDLVSVETFPTSAWLAPEPAGPFLDLIAITRAAYPEHPPYGDPELVPVPHCTVGVADDAAAVEEMARELRARLGPHLPIRCRAGELTLLEERPDGTWATRATFPFEGAA